MCFLIWIHIRNINCITQNPTHRSYENLVLINFIYNNLSLINNESTHLIILCSVLKYRNYRPMFPIYHTTIPAQVFRGNAVQVQLFAPPAAVPTLLFRFRGAWKKFGAKCISLWSCSRNSWTSATGTLGRIFIELINFRHVTCLFYCSCCFCCCTAVIFNSH